MCERGDEVLNTVYFDPPPIRGREQLMAAVAGVVGCSPEWLTQCDIIKGQIIINGNPDALNELLAAGQAGRLLTTMHQHQEVGAPVLLRALELNSSGHFETIVARCKNWHRCGRAESALLRLLDATAKELAAIGVIAALVRAEQKIFGETTSTTGAEETSASADGR